MTVQVAREIADGWKYRAPHDFYNADADPQDYAEFVDPARWPTVFDQVISGNEVIGFFQVLVSGGIREVALGMRPDLTGGGIGLMFVRACLSRADAKLGTAGTTRLVVAAFNQRAITVYKRAGFSIRREFDQETNGGVFRFIEMERARG